MARLISNAPRWLNEMQNDHGEVVALDATTGRIEFTDGYVTRRDADGNEVEDTHDYKADDVRESDARDPFNDETEKSTSDIDYATEQRRSLALNTASVHHDASAGINTLLDNAALIESYLDGSRRPTPTKGADPA